MLTSDTFFLAKTDVNGQNAKPLNHLHLPEKSLPRVVPFPLAAAIIKGVVPSWVCFSCRSKWNFFGSNCHGGMVWHGHSCPCELWLPAAISRSLVSTTSKCLTLSCHFGQLDIGTQLSLLTTADTNNKTLKKDTLQVFSTWKILKETSWLKQNHQPKQQELTKPNLGRSEATRLVMIPLRRFIDRRLAPTVAGILRRRWTLEKDLCQKKHQTCLRWHLCYIYLYLFDVPFKKHLQNPYLITSFAQSINHIVSAVYLMSQTFSTLVSSRNSTMSCPISWGLILVAFFLAVEQKIENNAKVTQTIHVSKAWP